MARPPPLPPRLKPAQHTPASPSESQQEAFLTPSGVGAGYRSRLHGSDPRTSSSQSLIAPATESDTRRSLLVVYVHGFYGNDRSFRSFPAHIHSLLSELLSDTHRVHSKIYPRYKTYRAIQVARDNFSAWLEPHQSPTTDVVLVGHSMGGLLAAEVVLMPNHDPRLRQPFKHCILGIVSLDSPFLGLHPGIVVSGLSSLFQPAPASGKETPSSDLPSNLSVAASASDLQLPLSEAASNASTTSPPLAPPNDPLYNPPYFNDAPFREKPLLERLRHFASKHKNEGIFNAIGNHIFSHLEFGGCMADYPELAARYKRIRALEDIDVLKAISEGHPPEAYKRVRFVNYYTLSPGRPKVSPPEVDKPIVTDITSSPPTLAERDMIEKPSSDVETLPRPSSNHSSGESRKPGSSSCDDKSGMKDAESLGDSRAEPDQEFSHNESTNDWEAENVRSSEDSGHLSMQHMEPAPIMEEETTSAPNPDGTAAAVLPEGQAELTLAPIPPEPEEPIFPDLSKYTDKKDRKQADKIAKRQQKLYQQAIKDRNKAIREREMLIEKRRKKFEKEALRIEKQRVKEMQELQKHQDKYMKEAAASDEVENMEDEARSAAAETAAATSSQGVDASPGKQKPEKLRKFCALPGKVHDQPDPTWVDVYMEDVDEVGAHCGLFVPGPHYDKLVGDVGSRVVAWLHEDMSLRAALDM